MLKKIPHIAICLLSFTFSANCFATETGLASYYSNKFHGKKTSTGERYDKNKLTAAHRTLPIGSQVEVMNLKTHDSVIVTINDRGPYTRRAIDLSYAAAKEIGLIHSGVAKVAITPVDLQKYADPADNLATEELIEIGQFTDSEELAMVDDMLLSGKSVTVYESSKETKRKKNSHS